MKIRILAIIAVLLFIVTVNTAAAGKTFDINVFEDYGADSFAGRVASVLAGSSETTFYATAMYFGSVHVKNTRHTLPAALAADFTALVMSVVTVRLFFYQN